MIPCQNSMPLNFQTSKDPHDLEKIDLLIQQHYNITIPSILLENCLQENAEYEISDFKSFFSLFGEIVDITVKGKIIIVLYNTFFDADNCYKYLLDETNAKEGMKNNFTARWFNYEKDMKYLTPEMENSFEKINKENASNIMDLNKNKIFSIMANGNKNKISNGINNNNLNNNINNNIINGSLNNLNQNNHNHININGNLNVNQNQASNNNIYISPNILMHYNQMNINQGMQGIQMNNMNNIQQNMHHMQNYGMQNIMMNPQMNIPMFMNQNLGGMNNIMNMQMNNHQYNSNQKQFNQNTEEKNYGKYTCKYEILIPNDKEFQVARRLIGSKGCNMKRILNECKSNNNINDNIKLRLRGRGSGYKEGPQNKESDEPLHLCISAKNQEEMKKACAKVDDLLNSIYEDYKKFCIKNKKTPIVKQLANRIDCGNSLHKTK